MVPDHVHDDDPDTSCIRVRSGIFLRLDDDDDRRDRRCLRIVGEFPDAAGDQYSNVGFGPIEIRGGHRLADP
jgi:hypothetical protein